MILLSAPVIDEISDCDPIQLCLEYDPDHGKCWLDIRRLGVRLGGGLAVYWDNHWVRRQIVEGAEEISDRVMTSPELVVVLLQCLREYHGQLSADDLLDVISEEKVAGTAVILEIMNS